MINACQGIKRKLATIVAGVLYVAASSFTFSQEVVIQIHSETTSHMEYFVVFLRHCPEPDDCEPTDWMCHAVRASEKIVGRCASDSLSYLGRRIGEHYVNAEDHEAPEVEHITVTKERNIIFEKVNAGTYSVFVSGKVPYCHKNVNVTDADRSVVVDVYQVPTNNYTVEFVVKPKDAATHSTTKNMSVTIRNDLNGISGLPGDGVVHNLGKLDGSGRIVTDMINHGIYTLVLEESGSGEDTSEYNFYTTVIDACNGDIVISGPCEGHLITGRFVKSNGDARLNIK